MATSNSPQGLVPNPMYVELSKLYSSLQRDAATLTNALKPANQQMAAWQTWVGPTAQAWGSQLDGYARDCGTQVNAMLADVEQAMRSEPAQVTPEVAQQKTRTLILMQHNI